jgi:low affinity Fe/Cu permease
MTTKHPVEAGGEGRGFFDNVAERASNVFSSPLFFAFCVGLIVVWILSYVLGWSDPLRWALGDMLGGVALLVVALLKNAERRAEHAVQFKLDAIAEALLEMHRDTDEGAADDLERAIGRHEDV